jgi:mRNA-degrading endonuclease RelE of RelBE toxin-antitoxin system
LNRDATPFEVLIDERVEKDLENIPKYIVKKFIKLLDEFEKDPIRPRSGFDLKPMKDTQRIHID